MNVKVKPLEWSKSAEDGSKEAYLAGPLPHVVYRVINFGTHWRAYINQDWVDDFPTHEEAQSCIWEEHEETILSALEPAPKVTEEERKAFLKKIRDAGEPFTDDATRSDAYPQSEKLTEEAAMREASRLALALHAKHFPHITAWQLESDLVGVLLQIDNMTSVLVHPEAPKVTEEAVEQIATVAEVRANGRVLYHNTYPVDALDKLPVGTPIYATLEAAQGGEG